MSHHRHTYNEEALRVAWRNAARQPDAATFWQSVRQKYRVLTGWAPNLQRLQQAANRRGMRARVHGGSRSASRWPRVQ